MRKIFFLMLVCSAVNVHGAQLVRGPYLENATPTSMTLRWQTDRAAASWLEYGPAPRCNQIMTITPAQQQHKVVLYGLVPNQDFCYHLYIENAARTGVQEPVSGNFRTLFSPERKVVTFLALGNTGADAVDAAEYTAQVEGRQAVADLMAREKADFVLHTGNLTHSGLNADVTSEFLLPFASVLRNAALFVALGPKEYGPDRASQDSKSFLYNNYTRYHDMTWSNATPKYYYFDTANARFIVLDGNIAQDAVWAPEITEDSAQTKWLKTTLSSAADKWKIVILNTPIFSTGSNGPNPQVYAAWKELFETYRVNLVLQGGDANYERTFPWRNDQINARGVTYVTLGTAAATPTKRAENEPYTARFVSTRHYAVGKIVDRKLTFTVYGETGKQLDKFEMYL